MRSTLSNVLQSVCAWKLPERVPCMYVCMYVCLSVLRSLRNHRNTPTRKNYVFSAILLYRHTPNGLMKTCNYNGATGRCTLHATTGRLNDPECLYNEPTKRCRSIRAAAKATRGRTTSRKPPAVAIDYHGYLVEKKVKTFLDKSVMNKHASIFRHTKDKFDLYIPLEEYTNDDDMKAYLLNEILDLSQNHAVDSLRYQSRKDVIILLVDVKRVLQYDDELRALITGKRP